MGSPSSVVAGAGQQTAASSRCGNLSLRGGQAAAGKLKSEVS